MLALLVMLVLLSLLGTAQGQGVKNPGTLVIMTIGDAESLDPATAYDNVSSEIILWNIYETLLFFKGSRIDQYVPMLATEVPSVTNGGISKDGKTYTFKIRQGVKFHDGSTMAPEDVKYSLMRFALIDRDGGPSWILLATILGSEHQSTRDGEGNLLPAVWDKVNRAIQVKGDTVSITLKDPYAPLLNIMNQWSMVVSKKFAIQNGGWDGSKATLAKYNNPAKPEVLELFGKASGTGPFKLESWDRARGTITLVRNDNYWRAPAKLQRIVVRKVEEFSARRLALQNGDADIITVERSDQPAVTGIPGVRIVDDLPRLLNSPALFMNLNINQEANPDTGTGVLDGNGIPPNFFADVHVRRAFAHLFDRERWIREAIGGKGRVANGPIPFGMLGYAAKGKWYEVSKDKAIAEFKEAHGGQVWQRGFKFTVLFNFTPPGRLTAAQMIKEATEALNPKFKIDVRGVTWANYLGRMRSKKLTMFVNGWFGDYADPDNFVVPFMHSTGTFTGWQSYKNPQADKLIEASAKETDQKKREKLYLQLQDLAYQDVPTVYIVYPVGFVVMRTWVKGWYHNPIFFGFGYHYVQSKE